VADSVTETVREFHGALGRRAGSSAYTTGTRQRSTGPAGFHLRSDDVADTETRNRKNIVRLYEEVANQGRLEVLDDIAWPDHVEHNPLPGQVQGIEGLKQRISMIRAANAPRFTLDHLLADGEKVAVMWTNQGTHVGELLGYPPTGKSVTVHGVDIHLLRDGRLAEHWDVVDVYGFLVQIGAVPAPGATSGVPR
jgi:predicted ester cyclase